MLTRNHRDGTTTYDYEFPCYNCAFNANKGIESQINKKWIARIAEARGFKQEVADSARGGFAHRDEVNWSKAGVDYWQGQIDSLQKEYDRELKERCGGYYRK